MGTWARRIRSVRGRAWVVVALAVTGVVVPATPSAATSRPGAPRNVVVVATGTTASVRFDVPSYAGGEPITRYDATCSSSDGGTTRTGRAAASPVSVASLTSGKTYRCTVTATNTIGTGAASTPSGTFVVGTSFAPAVPWAATSARDGLGLWIPGETNRVPAHEQWMGRPVDYQLVFTSIENFTDALADFRELTDPASGYVTADERTLIIAMGLTTRTGTAGSSAAASKLSAAANGANDGYWTEIGRTLHQRGLDRPFADGRPRVALRVGWEHNGDWFPWSSVAGREQLFVDAYRRARDRVDEQATSSTWTWGLTTFGRTSEDGIRAAYPGNAYVDVVEIDVYDCYGAYPPVGGDANPTLRAKTWTNKVDGRAGLSFVEAFAAEHGKPIGITETGLWRETISGQGQVGGGDDAQWIVNIRDWADRQAHQGRLAWINYFEGDAGARKHALRGTGAAPGSTAGSQFPSAAATFLKLFGSPPS